MAIAGLKWRVFLNTEVAEGTEKNTKIGDSSVHLNADDTGFVGGVEMAGDGITNHGL
jgi:hypothetical protein